MGFAGVLERQNQDRAQPQWADHLGLNIAKLLYGKANKCVI